MKLNATVLALVSFLAINSTAFAKQPNQLTAKEKKQGFVFCLMDIR